MGDKINKTFLENVRLSDLPVAWALQAQGFYYSAEAALRGNNIAQGKKFINLTEVHLSRFCYKTSCYLLSHSIELASKALLITYTQKDVENFSHKIPNIFEELIRGDILDKNEFDHETIKLADILLNWYGRYHRPSKNKINDIIKTLYVPSVEDPDLLEKKYTIDLNSYNKLKIIAEKLIDKLNISPPSIMPLVFDPF